MDEDIKEQFETIEERLERIDADLAALATLRADLAGVEGEIRTLHTAVAALQRRRE